MLWVVVVFQHFIYIVHLLTDSQFFVDEIMEVDELEFATFQYNNYNKQTTVVCGTPYNFYHSIDYGSDLGEPNLVCGDKYQIESDEHMNMIKRNVSILEGSGSFDENDYTMEEICEFLLCKETMPDSPFSVNEMEPHCCNDKMELLNSDDENFGGEVILGCGFVEVKDYEFEDDIDEAEAIELVSRLVNTLEPDVICGLFANLESPVNVGAGDVEFYDPYDFSLAHPQLTEMEPPTYYSFTEENTNCPSPNPDLVELQPVVVEMEPQSSNVTGPDHESESPSPIVLSDDEVSDEASDTPPSPIVLSDDEMSDTETTVEKRDPRVYNIFNATIEQHYTYELSKRTHIGENFMFFQGQQNLVGEEEVPNVLYISSTFTERHYKLGTSKIMVLPHRSYNLQLTSVARTNQIIIYSHSGDLRFTPRKSEKFPKPIRHVIPQSTNETFYYMCIDDTVLNSGTLEGTARIDRVSQLKSNTDMSRGGGLPSKIKLFHYFRADEFSTEEVMDTKKGRFYFAMIDEVAASKNLVLTQTNSKRGYNVKFTKGYR